MTRWAGFHFTQVDDVLKIPNSQAAIFWFKIFRQVADIRAFRSEAPPLSAMLEVLSVTGESIAVFEDEEIADPPASICQPDSAAVDPRAGKGEGKFFTPAEVGKGKGKFFTPRVPAPDADIYHRGGKGKGKFFTPRVPAPDADIYHRGGKGKGKFFAPRVPAPDADIYHRGGKGKGKILCSQSPCP